MERTRAAGSLPPLAVSALFVFLVGLAGGLLTQPSEWSRALLRPDWHPPAWVFGAVWAVVGASAVFALAAAWTGLIRSEDRKAFLTLMAVNAFFNVAWNALFFAGRRPDLAFIDIVALWVSIAAIITFLVTRGVSRAALLMSPYLIWVTIAAALNFEMVRLNAPF